MRTFERLLQRIRRRKAVRTRYGRIVTVIDRAAIEDHNARCYVVRLYRAYRKGL